MYCPPVFAEDLLISETVPETSLLVDFNVTFTGIPDFKRVIFCSETKTCACKAPGDSMVNKGIPGLAISPWLAYFAVIVPEIGAVTLVYLY